MIRVFITQLCNVSNKGDQAILNSEIFILKEIFTNVKISVSTLWSEELLKQIEPNIYVYSPLVDLKVGGKECPLILCPFIFFLQFFLSIISIMFIKIHLKPLYRPETLDQYRYADIIISSGHEPFMEGSIYDGRYPLYSKVANLFVLFWGAFDVFIAKKVFKKPFITFPQSIGPFRTFLGRCFASFIFKNLDAIVLRENFSLRFLKDIKTKTTIYVMADIAFLFKNCSELSHKLQKPLVGVSPCFSHSMSKVHKQNYILAVSRVLDYLVTNYGVNVAFLPSQIGQGKAATKQRMPDDYELCLMILQNMLHKNKAKILNVQTVEEIEYLIGQLDLLITTRMHPSILASINYIPFVSINYEHKQIGLLEKLALDNVGIDINDISYEILKSKVEYVWHERERIKKHLSLKTPILQDQIRTGMINVISKVITNEE